YRLEHVYVVCDGCTDKTAAIVRNLKKIYPQLVLMHDGQRKGKAQRLNELYRKNTSDYLLSLDADVVLGTPEEINKLVLKAIENKKAGVIAADLTPVEPKTFQAKIVYANHRLWDFIRRDLNDGNHITNLYGAATLLKKSFIEKIAYPKNITGDEEYLYFKAHQKNAFVLAKDTL